MEQFTDNPEDTALHAPTHIFSGLRFGTSHESGIKDQGSTVFTLTSQKTEIAKFACEPKMTRAPCRRRTDEAPPRAEKFGDLITADHKVLNEGCES